MKNLKCDGCGQRIRLAYAAGTSLIPGNTTWVPWVLCKACKRELRADEQGMLMRIELRLGVMQGNA